MVHDLRSMPASCHAKLQPSRPPHSISNPALGLVGAGLGEGVVESHAVPLSMGEHASESRRTKERGERRQGVGADLDEGLVAATAKLSLGRNKLRLVLLVLVLIASALCALVLVNTPTKSSPPPSPAPAPKTVAGISTAVQRTHSPTYYGTPRTGAPSSSSGGTVQYTPTSTAQPSTATPTRTPTAQPTTANPTRTPTAQPSTPTRTPTRTPTAQPTKKCNGYATADGYGGTGTNANGYNGNYNCCCEGAYNCNGYACNSAAYAGANYACGAYAACNANACDACACANAGAGDCACGYGGCASGRRRLSRNSTANSTGVVVP